MLLPNAHLQSYLEDEDGLLPHMQMHERKYITCFDPSTGIHIDTVLADDKDAIEQKIMAAAEAQKEWKKTTFAERRRVLRSLNKWLVENQLVCARVACRDTGKTCEGFQRLAESETDFSTSDRRRSWGDHYDLLEVGVDHEARRESFTAGEKEVELHLELQACGSAL
jgi:hypothetical protein